MRSEAGEVGKDQMVQGQAKGLSGNECDRKVIILGVQCQSHHTASDPESGLDCCCPGTWRAIQ